MTHFSWKCPHCQHAQIVTDPNYHTFQNRLQLTKLDIGTVALDTISISCLNSACQKLTLTVVLRKAVFSRANANWTIEEELQQWKLIPESSAKPQPEFIPEALRQDYLEACRIRDLSPKASATLARRCLQGMIRDFCKISRPTLDKEITALREMVSEDKMPKGVTPESVEAIDHVRKIGNIGARMEKDIDLIIDIEPKEAQILIDLVETLFEEWYIARHERTERFRNLAELRAQKDAEKTVPSAAKS